VLVVDAPPGTSDEHISIAQFLSLIDVRKELNFCKKVPRPRAAPWHSRLEHPSAKATA